MKTENEILEIAFLLFLEKGFSEVSTNELIRAAGLTKGGFTIPSKAETIWISRWWKNISDPFSLVRQRKCSRHGKKQSETPTAELLWKGFFLPQRFANYQKKIGKKIAFSEFLFPAL